MSQELIYIILIFSLFVVPKMLQRFRIPTAITSFGIGVLAGPAFGLMDEDQTINLLSVFGIVSLFLLAGLEVEYQALRSKKRIIVQHLGISFLALMALAMIIWKFLALDLRQAALIALAILTPSTGFILESLNVFDFNDEEKFWIKTKAIATELLALGTLLFVLQSTTGARLAISCLSLIAMVIILPLIFKMFATRIVPYAPRSEFAFLLMIAVLCAFATRTLGIYYLVGAFVVGLAAQRFREELPAIASEKMLDGIELFSSFFIPFYFFHAGLNIQPEDISQQSLGYASLLIMVFIPLRSVWVMIHRRIVMTENPKQGIRIGVSMLPTLIFTLVIAEILRDQFLIPPFIFGALVIYALANTLIPSFVFRLPPPEFDTPHIPHVDVIDEWRNALDATEKDEGAQKTTPSPDRKIEDKL